MAVKLEEIESFLKEQDVKHNVKDDFIYFLISSDRDITFFHKITLQENGGIFCWKVNILDSDNNAVCIKDNKYEDKVLSYMLYANYQTKFGTWEYDPGDGEIAATIEIPLEDALMTQKQLFRIYSYMAGDINNHAKEILHILKTGENPGTSEDDLLKLAALMKAMNEDDISDDDGI